MQALFHRSGSRARTGGLVGLAERHNDEVRSPPPLLSGYKCPIADLLLLVDAYRAGADFILVDFFNFDPFWVIFVVVVTTILWAQDLGAH